MIRDKSACARFLALVGYSIEQIRDCLAVRFNLPMGVAESEAKRAVERQRRRAAEDAAKLGKYEAAVEAEHSLDRTTWR